MFIACSVHASISDCLLFVKNGFVVGASTLNVTASHMLMARPRHCISATPSLHNSHCGTRAARQHCIHTVYIELGGRRHADRQRGTGKQRGRMEGGVEGSRGGREGGSDDVRQGGSGSGAGREG